MITDVNKVFTVELRTEPSQLDWGLETRGSKEDAWAQKDGNSVLSKGPGVKNNTDHGVVLLKDVAVWGTPSEMAWQ